MKKITDLNSQIDSSINFETIWNPVLEYIEKVRLEQNSNLTLKQIVLEYLEPEKADIKESKDKYIYQNNKVIVHDKDFITDSFFKKEILLNWSIEEDDGTYSFGLSHIYCPDGSTIYIKIK